MLIADTNPLASTWMSWLELSIAEKTTEPVSGMKRAHYDIIDNQVGGPASSSPDANGHVTSAFNPDAGRTTTRVVNVSKKVHACKST